MSEEIQQLVLWLIPVAPLASAVITALLGPKLLRYKSHLPCWSALAVSFVCSLILLLKILPSTGSAAVDPSEVGTFAGPQVLVSGYEWLNVGDLHANIELRAGAVACHCHPRNPGVNLGSIHQR